MVLEHFCKNVQKKKKSFFFSGHLPLSLPSLKGNCVSSSAWLLTVVPFLHPRPLPPFPEKSNCPLLTSTWPSAQSLRTAQLPAPCDERRKKTLKSRGFLNSHSPSPVGQLSFRLSELSAINLEFCLMLKCQGELLAGQLNKLTRSLARADAHEALFWNFPSEDRSLY